MTRFARLPVAGLALVGGLDPTWAGPADGKMRSRSSVPVFAREGPYGEPLQLVPPRHPLGVTTEAPGIADLSPVPRAATSADLSGRLPDAKSLPIQAPPVRPGTAATGEGDDAPVRPGTLGRDYVTIPAPIPNLRNRSLGPHLSPDAEFDVTSRTSMGVLGRADRLDVRPGAGIVPSVRARDLGAGVVLQYKLGP